MGERACVQILLLLLLLLRPTYLPTYRPTDLPTYLPTTPTPPTPTPTPTTTTATAKHHNTNSIAKNNKTPKHQNTRTPKGPRINDYSSGSPSLSLSLSLSLSHSLSSPSTLLHATRPRHSRFVERCAHDRLGLRRLTYLFQTTCICYFSRATSYEQLTTKNYHRPPMLALVSRRRSCGRSSPPCSRCSGSRKCRRPTAGTSRPSSRSATTPGCYSSSSASSSWQ